MPPARFAALAVLLMLVPDADAQTAYRKPPAPVGDILSAPPPPGVSLSPTRDTLLLTHRTRYPAVAELAQPMLRLAGVRVNPATNGPHPGPRGTGFSLLRLSADQPEPFALPAHDEPVTA